MMNILRETETSLNLMKAKPREFVDTEFNVFHYFPLLMISIKITLSNDIPRSLSIVFRYWAFNILCIGDTNIGPRIMGRLRMTGQRLLAVNVGLSENKYS